MIFAPKLKGSRVKSKSEMRRIARVAPHVMADKYYTLGEENKKLRAQLAIAKDALEYYGDPDNWKSRVSGHGDSSKDVIANDGGYMPPCAGIKARQTLALLGKDPS